ncbi:MAG: NmrA family NAD(P)-binding protein [Deltaproteobacteria bacterium]|nr:NmrA family NAD(P)-binding protein [Deltaproteobacteria bacterium]
MKSPFVICGSTGNVGSKIVGTLIAAGEPVRVMSREKVRLGPFAAKGAEPWPGDIGDPAFLEKAFAGARAVFAMIPPKYDAPDLRGYQTRVADALVSALGKARVPRVVTLSSVGAHLSEGTGPILGLHDLESKMERLRDAAVVHLRPTYFMENHLWSIPVIRSLGVNGSPIRPDVPIPMVATKDIADVAARLFLEETFTGHAVRYLLGPRDLTMVEATGILGRAIGKPDLRYVQFPEEEARKAMTGMGMSRSAVDAMIEMERGFNAGKVRPTRERAPENTTPTTLEEFARTAFAPAYQAAA